MIYSDSNWKEVLGDIFGGYLGQDSLKAAAESMAFVSEQEYKKHLEFIGAFNEGIKAADANDEDVIFIINDGHGYIVNTCEEAKEMLIELRDLYLDAYKREFE